MLSILLIHVLQGRMLFLARISSLAIGIPLFVVIIVKLHSVHDGKRNQDGGKWTLIYNYVKVKLPLQPDMGMTKIDTIL